MEAEVQRKLMGCETVGQMLNVIISEYKVDAAIPVLLRGVVIAFLSQAITYLNLKRKNTLEI